MKAIKLGPITSRRKVAPIVKALRALAAERGVHNKLPTVRELCGLLKVSSATLDDALLQLEQERIIERRHGSGIYVSEFIDQKCIGLVFGRNIFEPGASPFGLMLSKRCEQRAKSHNEDFAFFLDLPSFVKGSRRCPVNRQLAEAIENRKLHGILLAARHSEEEETWLRSQGVPVVSLSRAAHPCHTVAADMDLLISMAVDALVDQGCRKIGLITPFGYCRADPSIYQCADLQTFAARLRHHGLIRHPEWVWESRVKLEDETETREALGYRAMHALYGGGVKEVPDGLVIADDMMARGALAVAQELGLVLGRDLKVATHANKGSPVLAHFGANLTRIEVDPDEIVTKMFELLESLMEGRPVPTGEVMVKPRLVDGRDELTVEETRGGAQI